MGKRIYAVTGRGVNAEFRSREQAEAAVIAALGAGVAVEMHELLVTTCWRCRSPLTLTVGTMSQCGNCGAVHDLRRDQ